ncbi:MAG: hypothetical protein PHC61_18875, partial [Chitinivibrionales bacterium]|nr:hypothetical protein [Chitinivibrionales bacterium]
CGGGMSFDGHYLYLGHSSHTSYDIVNIDYPGGFANPADNGNSTTPVAGAGVKFIDFADATHGTHAYYNNGGATNNSDWICRGIQSVPSLGYQPGQCMSNWVTGEQFYVGLGDGGDFWVGSASQNAATMAFNPTSLNFTATKGGASPAAQTVQVTNSGTGTLNTVTTSVGYASGSGWLAVGKSGTGNTQTLTNTVTLGTLAVGSYQATVTVSCGNAQPASASYSVAFQVIDSSLTLANVTITPAKCTTTTWSAMTFTPVAVTGTGANLGQLPTFKWTVSNGQSIDSTKGIFTAGNTAGGPYTVTVNATYKGVAKSATATVLVYRPATITAPQTGATYKVGDTLAITWSRLANTTTTGLEIDLTTDQGIQWTQLTDSLIHDGTAAYYKGNTGTFKWKIPKSLSVSAGVTIQCVSSKCMVRLIAPYDSPAKATRDQTGVFTIVDNAAVKRPGGNLIGVAQSGKNAPVAMYDIRGRKIVNLKNVRSGVLIEQISGQGARLIVNTEARNRLP